MSRRTRSSAAVAASIITGLVAAPAAFAGRIDYTVPPSGSAAYSVLAEGHGNGIVKVTYNSCATVGQSYVLPLDVSPRGPVKGSPTAAWKVLKDGAATLAFDPETVTFGGGTQSTRITITPTAASAAGARLRIKLHGANGSGLGEGPGIMVTFACVLAPAPAPAAPTCPATTRAAGKVAPGQAKKDDALDPAPAPAPTTGNGDGNQGNGNGGPTAPAAPAAPTCPGPAPAAPAPGSEPAPAAPAPAAPAPAAPAPAVAPASITVPTQGAFPVVGSSLANRPARCVATPTLLRAVAGEQATIRVIVRPNGVPVRGSAVRITTPDGTVTKRTDRQGVALFRVRPSRSGRLSIQSDACFGVRTIRVLAARVTGTSGIAPKFTG